MSGGRQSWYVLGCYLAPCDASTLDSVVAAIVRHIRGTELLVAVNFNTNLELLDNNERDKAVAAVMETEGMEDMVSK